MSNNMNELKGPREMEYEEKAGEEYEIFQTQTSVSMVYKLNDVFTIENFSRLKLPDLPDNHEDLPDNDAETRKTFFGCVNELRDAELGRYSNRVQLRKMLEQSKTLFTELNGERLRLEFELKQFEKDNKFPSNKLMNDVEYEAFHNKQVIEMSRRMLSRQITDNILAQINMYLYMIKTKTQQMANTNHELASRVKWFAHFDVIIPQPSEQMVGSPISLDI